MLLFSALALMAIWLYLRDFSLYSFPLALLKSMYLYSAGFLLVSTIAVLLLRSREKECASQPEGFRGLLSYGLGIFWCIDGILQLQPQMAFGFGHFVIAQSSQSLPGVFSSSVAPLITFWASHEILLNAAAGSFQLFLGMSFLSLRTRRNVSRIAILSIAWGIGLWIFGEGMGGIFHPGASMLSGSPGSALIYVFISALVIAPSNRFAVRATTAAMSAIFLIFALIQGIPFEGYWNPGSIAAISSSLTVNPQPWIFVTTLRASAKLLSTTVVSWNAVLIAIMLAVGIMWAIKPRAAAYSTIIFSLIAWALWQDFGIFGFYSTDLNTAPVLVLISGSILMVTDRINISENKARGPTTGNA